LTDVDITSRPRIDTFLLIIDPSPSGFRMALTRISPTQGKGKAVLGWLFAMGQNTFKQLFFF
jgi:hypothetical protein